MEVRKKAISHFSKYNIRSFETYSKLEDVFVPLYFLHRYQTEAVVKLIGGLDYNYAKRDDNQTIVEDVSYENQNNALNLNIKHFRSKKFSYSDLKIKIISTKSI